MNKLAAILLGEVIKPLSRRIGTAAASALVAYGLDAAAVDAVEAAMTLLSGVAIDLVLSHLNREKTIALARAK